MRRARGHGHVSQERWLVSYADFITLLFAFFVVMYAVTRSHQVKAAQVSEAVQQGFKSMSAPGQLAKMAANAKPAAPQPQVQTVTVTEARVTSAAAARVDLEQVRKQLENALAKQIAAKAVTVQLGPDGLVISLRETGFFDSGTATPRPEAVATLKEIAAELQKTDYDVRVEGHTDNIPIHTALFDSNWDLSSARATRIARLLLDLRALPPERLSAAGYGEYHPVASNDTPEGRALNRRVDLVVFPRVTLNIPQRPSNAPKGWRSIFEDDPAPVRR